MRPWSGRVLLTSKKLGSSGLICPDINPASHAFLATVPWCCYSIPHGTFKSTFCIDLLQFSQCWTVLGWHSGDSDGPFGGAITVNSWCQQPSTMWYLKLAGKAPWGVQGPAPQNPAAWGHNALGTLRHEQPTPNLSNTSSTPVKLFTGQQKQQVIYWLS